jgi:hypothetical protein
MPLNLTKINCIILKIGSKAEFMSKSQNIWQQIILLCTTVMQMICTWPKIWTLSGRLSNGCVRFVFKLSPWLLLFLCWYVLLIYFVMIRLFIIYLSYLNIDKLLQLKFAKEICRIKIITIPLSRWRMFYIMLNVYIFNSFKEPLAINCMAYLV